MRTRTHATDHALARTAGTVKALLAPLLAASLLAYPLFQAFSAQAETTEDGGPGVTVTMGVAVTEDDSTEGGLAGDAPAADGSTTENPAAEEETATPENVPGEPTATVDDTSTPAAPDARDAAPADTVVPSVPDAPSDPDAAAPDAAETSDGTPCGPDATLALETGVPMAGGESANPMDALLETVARQQVEGSPIEVAYADEDTGQVAYA